MLLTTEINPLNILIDLIVTIGFYSFFVSIIAFVFIIVLILINNNFWYKYEFHRELRLKLERFFILTAIITVILTIPFFIKIFTMFE